MLNANQYQSGDYIISGCPNAFKEIAEQLANFAGYIALYETMHARLNEN